MKGAWSVLVLRLRIGARTAVLAGLGVGLIWRVGDSFGRGGREVMPPLGIIGIFWGLAWMLIAGWNLGRGMSRGPGGFALARPIEASVIFPMTLVADLGLWAIFQAVIAALNPRARAALASFDPTHPATWALVFGGALFYGLGAFSTYSVVSTEGGLVRRLKGLAGALRFAPLLLGAAFTADLQIRDLGERLGKPLIWDALPFLLLATVPLSAAWSAISGGRADSSRGQRLGRRALIVSGTAAAALIGAAREWALAADPGKLSSAEVLALGDRTIGVHGRPSGLRRWVRWQFVRDIETGSTLALPHLPAWGLDPRITPGRDAFGFVAFTERAPWPTFVWNAGFEMRIRRGEDSWSTPVFAGRFEQFEVRPVVGMSDDGEFIVRSAPNGLVVTETRTGRDAASFEADSNGIPFFVAIRDPLPWFVVRRVDGLRKGIVGTLYDPKSSRETRRFSIEGAGLGVANARIEGRTGRVLALSPQGRLMIGDADAGGTIVLNPGLPVFSPDATCLEDGTIVWAFGTAQGVEARVVRPVGPIVRIPVAPYPARFEGFGPEARNGVIAIGVAAPGGDATVLVDVMKGLVTRSLVGRPLRRLSGRGGWTWPSPRPGSPGARLLRKPDGSVALFDAVTGTERTVFQPGPSER